MAFLNHPTPTSRLLPLQFRKIWKKLFLLEVSASPDGRKLWRSMFVSLLVLAGVYSLLGWVSTPRETFDLLVLLAPVIGAFSVLIFAVVFYQWLYIWTYYYNVGESFLTIRKGVLVRQEITVPFSRIQDVYLDQDAMDYLLKLYDLHVSTATASSGLEAHIDGLNGTNARKLRDLILAKVETANAAHPTGGGV